MKRAECMSATQTKAMGKLARTHANCIAKTGVARPGKTKQDKLRRDK